MTMLSMLRPRITTDARDRLVIAPHRPDRLRRSPARPGAVERDRFQQALTWNVFRTLELLTPACWLRRLHVRLTGDEPPPRADREGVAVAGTVARHAVEWLQDVGVEPAVG